MMIKTSNYIVETFSKSILVDVGRAFILRQRPPVVWIAGIGKLNKATLSSSMMEIDEQTVAQAMYDFLDNGENK